MLPRYKILLELYASMLAARNASRSISVMEIGTHRGTMANEFILRALQAGYDIHYWGFDLFEDLTDQRKALEFCGKAKPPAMAEVFKTLNRFAPRATVRLVKGDTRVTLREISTQSEAHIFDFVWLDGGHSPATIESDFRHAERMLAPDGMIVLDDYYIERDDVGARSLVYKLQGSPLHSVKLTEDGDYDPNTKLTIHLAIVRPAHP